MKRSTTRTWLVRVVVDAMRKTRCTPTSSSAITSQAPDVAIKGQLKDEGLSRQQRHCAENSAELISTL
jgi:hypothetical protein